MPYIFRCPYCNEESVVYSDDKSDWDENCMDCGEDMCRLCINKGRCDNCEKRLDEEA